jgi:hypothetical protein
MTCNSYAVKITGVPERLMDQSCPLPTRYVPRWPNVRDSQHIFKYILTALAHSEDGEWRSWTFLPPRAFGTTVHA